MDLFERQNLHALDPWKLQPILLRPCRVRILIVTDEGGSFGLDNFGLKALIDALAVAPGPYVRFDITTANRRNDPTADLQGFTFDGQALDDFHEIWMFAVENSWYTPLTDAEVRAVAKFMDAGGGVFATGDHEDLGVAMCGRIPRVRSMRKWHWPGPGPHGEPVAPAGGTADRHDTLSAGHDTGIQFDDQSDDVPQRINPRMYPAGPVSKWFRRTYPHPLLCGPRGVIRVLPDHPHEGECYVPSDLSATLTFDGYTTTEYPGGIAPEVVATSAMTGRITDEHKGQLNARTFGAIGAYDGQRADVGRVVVDATWHHFFNINLIGELGSSDPVKSVGFAASVSGQAAYEDIKSYYRNIAVWLAPAPVQRCMWWRALWTTRWHHQIRMDVRAEYLADPGRLDLAETLRIGGEARDVLGRIASRCMVLRWIGVELGPLRSPVPYPDPWLPEERPLDPAEAVHAEMLVDAVLGAAVYALARSFPAADDDARARGEDVDFTEVIDESVQRGLDLVADHTDEVGRRLSELASRTRRR